MGLLEHLDSTDQPFSVETVPLSRKRKRGDTKLQIQDDFLEARLAVQYRVEPKRDWESLRRYKKFTGKEEPTVNSTDDHVTILTDGESSGL
jgi:hypothetical protein